MLAEELILHFLPKVFRKYKIVAKSLIRITRNADIDADSIYDEDLNYRDHMAEVVKLRKKLCPVRMEMTRELDETILRRFCEVLGLKEQQVFRMESPMDLSFLFRIQDELRTKPELFYQRRIPQNSPMIDRAQPVIPQILEKDILLSYPYESIKPFLNMLHEAAWDPKVVSIKMTLYRLAKDSKVVEALVEAAENGKQVDVLVELKARFDEENNIEWSRRLEDAGCHVIYGLDGLKVHSKLCLITRREEGKIEYITQIGTGNYNEKTARLYTDLSLMTADPEIGQDAYIGIKINSLTDKKIIDKLIEASKAGVRIEMVIRGINCIQSGIAGKTDHIRVISIVGRYLEHSRIYFFGTGEREQVSIASADFMTRNTLRRVEVAVPIKDEALRDRLRAMFRIMLEDNVKARVQLADGSYRHVSRPDGEEPLNSQEYFFEKTYEAAGNLGAIRKECRKESRSSVISSAAPLCNS